MRDELGVQWISPGEELDVKGRGDVVGRWASVQQRATEKVHGHEQLLLRPHADFARGDAHGLTGGIERCRDLTHDSGAGWVLDVDDEDARMRMRAGIQAGRCLTRITDSAPARAIPYDCPRTGNVCRSRLPRSFRVRKVGFGRPVGHFLLCLE